MQTTHRVGDWFEEDELLRPRAVLLPVSSGGLVHAYGMKCRGSGPQGTVQKPKTVLSTAFKQKMMRLLAGQMAFENNAQVHPKISEA